MDTRTRAGIDRVAAFFDRYAEKEWDRLEKTLSNRIEAAIHRRMVLKYVHRGDLVLDLGSGPGRYAIEMMRRGAKVTLGDISPVQLELAKTKVAQAGFEAQGFHRVDITDLSPFASESFDVVLCIGGALSYAQEAYDEATRGMFRLVRPGGILLLGFMSLYGQLRAFVAGDSQDAIENWDDHFDHNQVLNNPGYMMTRRGSRIIHMPLMLFTADYLRRYLDDLGCEVIGMATANPLSVDGLTLPRITNNGAAADRLIELEVSLSEREEYLDTGEWLIVASRKRT